MPSYIFDSSAALAILLAERGSTRAVECASSGCIGAANLAEVVTRLIDIGMPAEAAQTAVDDLELAVEPVVAEDAGRAGVMRPATRSRGLSLGDRLCLAQAMRLEATAVTADRAWADLDLGVDIELIR